MESRFKDGISLSLGSLITVIAYFFLSNANNFEIYYLNRLLLIFLILISIYLININLKESKIFYSSIPLIFIIAIFTFIESTFVLLIFNIFIIIKFFNLIKSSLNKNLFIGILFGLIPLITSNLRFVNVANNSLFINAGTRHHDALYRSATANMFKNFGFLSSGVNEKNTYLDHFLSEILLGLFSFLNNLSISSLDLLFLFQYGLLFSIYIFNLANFLSPKKISILFFIKICLLFYNPLIFTKYFLNLPFLLSVIITIDAFVNIKYTQKLSNIKFLYILFIGVLIIFSKVQIGFVFSIIFIYTLFQIRKYLFLLISAFIYLLSAFLVLNNYFDSEVGIVRSLNVGSFESFIRTNIILILILIFIVFTKKQNTKIPFIILITFFLLLNTYYPLGNQGYYMDFVLLIAFLGFFDFKYPDKILLFSLIFSLLIPLTFFQNLLGFYEAKSNLHFKNKSTQNIEFHKSINNLYKKNKNYLYFADNNNQIHWNLFYSCLSPVLVIQGVYGFPVALNIPEEAMNDCGDHFQEYGIYVYNIDEVSVCSVANMHNYKGYFEITNNYEIHKTDC